MPNDTTVIPMAAGNLFGKKSSASSMGAIRAAAFGKKLKAKANKKVDHELRNMLIAFIPLFALIGLAAFILQLLEHDNEFQSEKRKVFDTHLVNTKFKAILDRTYETLDIGNMDRIHAPVDIPTVPTADNSSSSQGSSLHEFNWTMTVKSVYCYKNGTLEVLAKPVSITISYLLIFNFRSIYNKTKTLTTFIFFLFFLIKTSIK